MEYFGKMKGGAKSPPRVDAVEIPGRGWGLLPGPPPWRRSTTHLLAGTDRVMLIGSFGASAVLVYGAVRSPLAQPRNLVGGHVISAAIGVAAHQLLGAAPWLAAAAAVATAIAAMHATRTLHPPGGATALIAVIGGDQIHALGYLYVLAPVGLGAALLLLVALLVNNLPQAAGTRSSGSDGDGFAKKPDFGVALHPALAAAYVKYASLGGIRAP